MGEPGGQPITPPHLGGHQWKTHVDSGAISYLRGKLGVHTLVDIGCGPGGQVRNANRSGMKAIGIDGDPVLIGGEWFMRHDFTTGPADYGIAAGRFDLAWSCEFLEHVEERFLPNVMELFKRCGWAAVTAAPPGKGGHHHVNCQTSEYWIERFGEAGLEYQSDMTMEMRRQSTMGREFMRNTGLLFKNTGEA